MRRLLSRYYYDRVLAGTPDSRPLSLDELNTWLQGKGAVECDHYVRVLSRGMLELSEAKENLDAFDVRGYGLRIYLPMVVVATNSLTILHPSWSACRSASTTFSSFSVLSSASLLKPLRTKTKRLGGEQARCHSTTQSPRRLTDLFRWPNLSKVVVGRPTVADMDVDVKARLREVTAVDRELYEYASAAFRRQKQAVRGQDRMGGSYDWFCLIVQLKCVMMTSCPHWWISRSSPLHLFLTGPFVLSRSRISLHAKLSSRQRSQPLISAAHMRIQTQTCSREKIATTFNYPLMSDRFASLPVFSTRPNWASKR